MGWKSLTLLVNTKSDFILSGLDKSKASSSLDIEVMSLVRTLNTRELLPLFPLM